MWFKALLILLICKQTKFSPTSVRLLWFAEYKTLTWHWTQAHSAMFLQVTFRNLTDEPVVVQIHPRKRMETQVHLTLHASCCLTTKVGKGELSLHPHFRTLTEDVPHLVFEKSLALEEGRLFDSADDKISLSTIFRGSWNVVHVSKWRILSFRVWNAFCRPRVVWWIVNFHPQVSRRHRQMVILHRRNLASFLADMPDQVPLSSLMLPGVQ